MYLEKSKFAGKRHDRGYQGLGEEEDEKLLFNRYRVSVWDDVNRYRVSVWDDVNRYRVFFWDDEKVVEGDSLDGCTTLQKYVMPLNCKFKLYS